MSINQQEIKSCNRTKGENNKIIIKTGNKKFPEFSSKKKNNNNNNNIDINIKDNNTEIGNQFSPQKKVNYQSSSSEYGAYFYMK